MGHRRLVVCILIYTALQQSHASSILRKSLQPHASVKFRFGAEHSPDPCNANMYESAKIDGETQLGIEVPLGTDHRNILLHKIGSYLTVIMKALAKTVEPLHGNDGSSTHLDFHLNAELKEPQDHVTVTDHPPKELVLHTLRAGERCPQTRTQYPIPSALEHNSELSHAAIAHHAGQSYSYLNYAQPHEDIPQTSYPTEKLNHVPEYHQHTTKTGHSTGSKVSDVVVQSFNGLLPGIVNIDVSADDGTLPIIGNIVGPTNDGLLPDSSNDDSSPDGEILPAISGVANRGVPPRTLNNVGEILAGTGNTAGPSVGGVLPGNGNILELDLSVPATQPDPISYYVLQQPQSALPVDQLTRTHISTESGRSENDGLLPGTGDIFGPENGGTFPGIGIIPGPVISDELLGIDALVALGVRPGNGNIQRPAESGVLSEPVGSTDSGVLPGVGNTVGQIVGVLPGDTGQEGGDLLLGNGNILEIDLSLPATQPDPISYYVLQHLQNALPVDQLTRTHISTESGRSENDGLLPGTGDIFGPENGGTFTGIGNTADPVISDGLLGIDALVALGVHPGNGNIRRPAEGGVISGPVGSTDSGVPPGVGNTVGEIVAGVRPGDTITEGSDLLLGNGNILEIDLSLPATQLNPILYNSIPHHQGALPIDYSTGTYIPPVSDRPENFGLIPGTGNIIESEFISNLPGTGNIAGPVIIDGLSEIEALVAANVHSGAGNVQRPVEGGAILETVGSTNIRVPPDIRDTVGQIAEGVFPGNIVPEVDGLLPGNGYIHDLDPSLTATQLNTVLYNSIQNHRSALPIDHGTGTQIPADQDRHENLSLFPGTGNIVETENGGTFPGTGNIAGPVINDGLPEIHALVAAGVNFGNENIEQRGEGGLIPTAANVFEPVDGDLLPIKGNILQSGLSLAASQPIPTIYKIIGHTPGVLPIDQDTTTVASENSHPLPVIGDKLIPENGIIFNGIGNIANGNTVGRENDSPLPGTEYIVRTVAGGLLPGIVNSVEPEISSTYSGVGSILVPPVGNTLHDNENIIESFKESLISGAGNSQFTPTSKPFSASHNSLLPPSLSVPHFANSKENDYGSGASTGGVIPGIGNILHLDLSLPDSESFLLPQNPITLASDSFTIGQGIQTPKVPGHYLLINPDLNHLSSLQQTEPSNSNLLSGIGSIVYIPSGSGSIHSLPGQETLVIPSHSLRPTQTKGGVEVAIETRPYLPGHSEVVYSVADDRHIDTQSLGRTDGSFTNVHNHLFQIWPTTHTVHTVETNTPATQSDIFHLQSVSQLEFSKSPLSYTDRNEDSASTSDKSKIAKVENAKTTKILPLNGISHAKILNSDALLDTLGPSEALNQVPHVDHSFQHTIVSTSKYRDNEHQMYRPDNDLSLKHLQYKYVPYNKDRSMEAPDELHEVTQVDTGNVFWMGDRIITRDEGDPYYERLQNSKNLPLANPGSLVDTLKNSEHNDRDMTEKEQNRDIIEPNITIPTDAIRTHATKLLDNNDISRFDKKASDYSVPENGEQYFENRVLIEQPQAEYASEYNTDLPLLSNINTGEMRTQGSGTEEQISFHEPKIPLQDEEVAYSDFSSFKETESSLLNDKITDDAHSFSLPTNRENSPWNSMVRYNSNIDSVEKSVSEVKKDDTSITDLTSIIDTYPGENISGHSKLSIDEAQEKSEYRMQSQDNHYNVNYEPPDSSVSYPSGNSITVPLTPSLPSYKPLDKKYYEIPPSSILVPQHSTDIDSSTYEKIMSLQKYINTLNNEQIVSPLIQSGSHATSIPYVSELLDEGGSENVLPSHQEVIVSEPALTSLSETGDDEDSVRYSDSLYSPHWETLLRDISQPIEAGESLSTSSHHEVNAYDVEPSQKSNSDLEHRSHDSRLRSHLANHQQDFQTDPTHSHELQLHPHGLDQKHKSYLTPQDRQSDLRLSGKKYEPHSTPEHHQEKDSHAHLPEQKQDLESASVYGREERRSYSLRNDVEPDLHRQNFHLEPHSLPEDREIKPHSYVSGINLVPYSVSAHQEIKPQSFSLYQDINPHAYLSDYSLEPSSTTAQVQHHSYISERNHENESSSITPFLEHEQIRISNEQREPHSHQHIELRKSSGTHETESHFAPLEPSFTHEVQPQQEFDSYLVHEAGSYLSHEMKAHLLDHLQGQSYLVNGIDTNSQSHDKDKKHKTLYNHKLEPKSQQNHANSRIKLQKVTEELKRNDEASLQREAKISSPSYHEVQTFVSQHTERSPVRSNKEIKSPLISHDEEYPYIEANPPTPSDLNAVNAMMLTDINEPSNDEPEPRTQLQHDTSLQKPSHHNTVPLISGQSTSFHHAGEPHILSHLQYDPKKQAHYKSAPSATTQQSNGVSVPLHHKSQAHISSQLQVNLQEQSHHSSVTAAPLHVNEPQIPLHNEVETYLPSLLETDPKKPLHRKPVPSIPLQGLNGISIPLHHEAEPYIQTDLESASHRSTVISPVSPHESAIHVKPQIPLGLDGHTSSFHTNLFPIESRNTNEHPILSNHKVKSSESTEFDPSLKKPPSQEGVPYVSSYHVLQPEAVSNHESETHIQSHYSSIKPYFLNQPSYPPFHELQADTQSDIQVENQTPYQLNTTKSHYRSHLSHPLHHHTELQKSLNLDDEPQTSHDKNLYPIYMIEPSVIPGHATLSHATEADTQPRHKNENPLTPSHVGDLAIPPYQTSKSPTTNHHEPEASRSEERDTSTHIPIAFVDRNALFDPNSNVFHPNYTGDKSARSRIICLTEERENTELLRSLKDDITILKQKLSCG